MENTTKSNVEGKVNSKKSIISQTHLLITYGIPMCNQPGYLYRRPKKIIKTLSPKQTYQKAIDLVQFDMKRLKLSDRNSKSTV